MDKYTVSVLPYYDIEATDEYDAATQVAEMFRQPHNTIHMIVGNHQVTVHVNHDNTIVATNSVYGGTPQ